MTPSTMIAFTLLTIATLAIAWRTEAATCAVPIAGALAALVIAHWAIDIDWYTLIAPSGATGPASRTIAPALRLASGARLWPRGAVRRRGLPGARPLAARRSADPVGGDRIAVPLAILIALYYSHLRLRALAPLRGARACSRAVRGRDRSLEQARAAPRQPSAAAIFATGSIAALALALTFALEKGWLTVALALMVPGIAWVAEQRPLPVAALALRPSLVVLVMARIGYEPRIVGDDIGTTPIFNWILYGYGVPALAFWLAGHVLRRRADDVPARMVEAAAILFTVLPAFLEIRHYLPATSTAPRAGCRGRAAGLRRLAMAIGLERLRVSTVASCTMGARLIARERLGMIVLSLVLCVNPLLHRRAGRRRVLQPDPARLRDSGGACGILGAHRGTRPMVSRDRRGHRGRARAHLSLAPDRTPLSRAAPDGRRRPATPRVHLLGRLARLRRRAARRRHLPALADRAARLGGVVVLTVAQGVPLDMARSDRHLPRSVLPRTWRGADRDRLVLPAAPVPRAPRRRVRLPD